MTEFDSRFKQSLSVCVKTAGKDLTEDCEDVPYDDVVDMLGCRLATAILKRRPAVAAQPAVTMPPETDAAPAPVAAADAESAAIITFRPALPGRGINVTSVPYMWA